MRHIRDVALALAVSLAVASAPVSAWAETSEQVREEAQAVQAELDDLTSQISEGERRVSELQQQVEDLADQSVELQGKLIEDRDRLAHIVASNYKRNSDARVLALILSSESVDELISQVYYAQKVSDWQTECIEELEGDKQALEQQMKQIGEAKDQQEELLADLADKHDELDAKVAELEDKADRLQAEEEEAARKAAEEAARKAEEERKAREAREAAERARQEALAAAQAAGDVEVTQTQEGGSGWITCIASAYTIADNDPPGSTATASGIPLDESVPTVAMPMSMSPARFYGSRIEISYNGMSIVATVTDCGAMGGGSRGLDLTPAVFRAFGASSADEWGLRQVRYRFL